MIQETVIKILFVEDSLENAERVTSLLRNAGFAVRPTRASNEAEFVAALDSLSPDLVVANPACRDLTLQEVTRLINVSARDIALIALVDEIDAEGLAHVFSAGARSVGLPTHAKQLRAVVEGAIDALQTRRQVRQLEMALRESERRCDGLLDSSRDPIAYVHEGMHVRANQAYLDMLGFESFEEIEGMTLLDMVADADTEEFRSLLKRLSRGEPPPTHIELQLKQGDGGTFAAVIEFTHATFEGERCLQIIIRREAVDESLIEQLKLDAATGLYNRQYFMDVLGEAIAETASGRSDQAILVIEPDHFSSVLERIGISRLDILMRAIAERLRKIIHPADTAARLSDRSFGLLLRGRPHEATEVFAESLLKNICSELFDLGNHSLAISISVGGSLLGEKNADSSLLIDQAVNMLRSAQGQGGNQFVLYDPSAQERAEAKKDKRWLALLEDTLENDRFVLFHQQIIALMGEETLFSELLLRMEGAQGIVLPKTFLSVAERHGLMPRVDRWVLHEAILQLSSADNNSQCFMVKVSTSSLLDPKLASWLALQIKQHPFDPRRLVLEMREDSVMTHLRPAKQFARVVKTIGCRIALERFGVGLNSFQILDHVDADFLKLDRTFSADLPRNVENQQHVRDICQRAQDLHKETIAEWVEDVASVSLLFGFSTSYVQGNFQHEPERLLAAERTT